MEKYFSGAPWGLVTKTGALRFGFAEAAINTSEADVQVFFNTFCFYNVADPLK